MIIGLIRRDRNIRKRKVNIMKNKISSERKDKSRQILRKKVEIRKVRKMMRLSNRTN